MADLEKVVEKKKEPVIKITPKTDLPRTEDLIMKDDNKKKPKICYYFQGNGYYAENVFPTLEEAKAEVARRNKLLKTEQKEEK